MRKKRILVYWAHLDVLLVYVARLLLRDRDQVLNRGFEDGGADEEGGMPLLERVGRV